jgi:hypothetical protein
VTDPVAVATGRAHRRRLTLVETGDAALAFTLAGLLAAAVVLWRRRSG